MKEIRIESLSSHPGNEGNFDRLIRASVTDNGHLGGKWLNLEVVTLSSYRAAFLGAISIQAAERLLVALDVLLSDARGEAIEAAE